MKFSIIVPVYNVAAELPRAVASVVSQTFPEWELILVDDGSCDESGALCDRFAEKNSRIKAMHQKNFGVVFARLNGFRASVGDWVLFLDGDDELFPSCLSAINGMLVENDVDMVQFGFETMQLDNRRTVSSPRLVGVHSISSVLCNSRKTPLEILGSCIGDKCYRRDIVEKVFKIIGDIRISYSEDALFALTAFYNVNHIYFDKRVFYRYILRKGSAVHKLNLNIVKEKQIFISTIKKLAEDSGRYPIELIDSMVAFHAYEACCYIFLMLLRNKGKYNDVVFVLRELHNSWLFTYKNPEVRSVKRRAMYLLLNHPMLYYVVGKIVLAFKAVR